MTAERDSMTLNEVSVPALGVEERSDEAPRAGRARPTPDPEVAGDPVAGQRFRRQAEQYGCLVRVQIIFLLRHSRLPWLGWRPEHSRRIGGHRSAETGPRGWSICDSQNDHPNGDKRGQTGTNGDKRGHDDDRNRRFQAGIGPKRGRSDL